jgi:tetrahydromethanopterin S-methyltransferase subunit C
MRLTRRGVAAAQGSLYVTTGIWPLVSMRTFEAVTGPKADRWLVRTVGLLVTVLGAVLLRDAATGMREPDAALATGAALSLATVDVVYASRRRISRVYLLDALAEGILAIAWVTARPRTAPSVSPAD